jgi:integrase
LTQQYLVNFIHGIRKGRSPITVDRYLSYLKCMFQWAVRHRFITRNPLELWSKRKEAPKDFKLTHEDVKKIIEVAPPHIAWAVEVAYNLGVRTGQSELLALEWRHVDWENGYVRVYGRKTKTWRRVKVSPKFLEKLGRKKAEAQTQFLVEYQERQVKRISKGFRTACKTAGISGEIISYDIRNLFCSTLLSRGASVKTVSTMMGHANSSMTITRYAHVLPGEEERAVALLPELD